MGAGHLKVGDTIKQADGTTGLVANVTTVQQTREMFNLTVSEAHTYYVGNDGWLVHNVGAPRATDVNRLVNQVDGNPWLERAARSMSDKAQQDVDNIIEQLRNGNANPGKGTKALDNGFLESRGQNGGRVIVKQIEGGYEILAKFQGHALGDNANSKFI